jgi:Na+-transporting NADH:ubiquinone oxidoreductase subunit NqrE
MIIANFTVFVAASAIVDAVDTLALVLLAALATGIGLFLALVPLAAIRRELRNRRLPEVLRGDASVYIAAALMALAIQQIDRLLQTLPVPIF